AGRPGSVLVADECAHEQVVEDALRIAEILARRIEVVGEAPRPFPADTQRPAARNRVTRVVRATRLSDRGDDGKACRRDYGDEADALDPGCHPSPFRARGIWKPWRRRAVTARRQTKPHKRIDPRLVRKLASGCVGG